uniref:Uncharacterized protein n=1 Tax=Aegilops tauschii subsp. strangulata TaxID=200361 RepID=A0A453NYK2_AEGTS
RIQSIAPQFSLLIPCCDLARTHLHAHLQLNSLVRPWGGRLRCLVWLLYSSISQTGQRRRSGSRAQGRSGSREETSSSILTALLPSASIQVMWVWILSPADRLDPP